MCVRGDGTGCGWAAFMEIMLTSLPSHALDEQVNSKIN